jgi:ornithine carbamoyltransferase
MASSARVAPIFKLPARIAASDITSDLDLSQDELLGLLDWAAKLKRTPSRFTKSLSGRYLSLLFEKPSLRTRLTFELAIKQLGGDAVVNIGPIGDREPLKDVARNLDRWTQCIVARTFSQKIIEELAHWSKVPVINALSDMFHPCQALADIFTLQERYGTLRGRKLAFVGDGNNVAHSLMLCALRLGMNFALATPMGYEANATVLQDAEAFAAISGARLTLTYDAAEAVAGADAIYTDVWTSMGQEDEKAQRLADFGPYQVNESLFAKAAPHCAFMHCLPAKRGEEVTDAVMECPGSVVFDQAENRLHAQKALLLMLLGQ